MTKVAEAPSSSKFLTQDGLEYYVFISLRKIADEIKVSEPPMVSGLWLRNRVCNILIDIRKDFKDAPQRLKDVFRTIESSTKDLQRDRALAILSGDYVRP